MSEGLPTYSVVVEWENARLSELGRTREMLKQLHDQIIEVGHPRPTIIILHDEDHIDRQLIEDFVGEVSELEAWPADIRIVPTEGLEYYEQKNFGAQQSGTDLVIFLDSDVVPEQGWLAGLLEAFQNPDVQVACGNTYMSLDDLSSKAFALFWFFPLRSEESGLRRANHFWANNLAFRRGTFEAFSGFPTLPTVRGQCTALAKNLRQHGIDIFLQQRSRVSHPAPNGLQHFVNRALCQGHDVVEARRYQQGKEKRGTSLTASSKWYVRRLDQSMKRIARHYRDVQLTPAGAVGAFGMAVCFYTLAFVGALLTVVRPELVRRHFAV